MADKSISELVSATQVTDTDLFVLEQSGTAKKYTGLLLRLWLLQMADGHGGISSITYDPPVAPSLTGTMTVTLADNTEVEVPVSNGRGITGITWQDSGTSGDGQTHTGTIAYNDGTTGTVTVRDGVKGDTGAQTYVWIRYAAVLPTSDADVGTTPDKWIGIHIGLASTAPTEYTAYTWYQFKGEKGDTGDPAELEAQTVLYQLSASGSTVPTGAWSATMPTPVQGMYLWCWTHLEFNSGSDIDTYTVSRYGVDGQGSPASIDQLPQMDGTAATGSGAAYARWDHVHPTDTSRAPAGAVSYASAQTLTALEQAQAMANMGLGSAATLDYTEIT